MKEGYYSVLSDLYDVNVRDICVNAMTLCDVCVNFIESCDMKVLCGRIHEKVLWEM